MLWVILGLFLCILVSYNLFVFCWFFHWKWYYVMLSNYIPTDIHAANLITISLNIVLLWIACLIFKLILTEYLGLCYTTSEVKLELISNYQNNRFCSSHVPFYYDKYIPLHEKWSYAHESTLTFRKKLKRIFFTQKDNLKRVYVSSKITQTSPRSHER